MMGLGLGWVVGVELSAKRSFNNLQGHGWHLSPLKSLVSTLTDCKRIAELSFQKHPFVELTDTGNAPSRFQCVWTVQFLNSFKVFGCDGITNFPQVF